MINLLLIDGSRAFRSRLTGILVDYVPEINLIGQAGDIAEAETILTKVHPDAIALNIRAENYNLADFLRIVKKDYESVIIAIADFPDFDYQSLYKNGEIIFSICKSDDLDKIIDTFKEIVSYCNNVKDKAI